MRYGVVLESPKLTGWQVRCLQHLAALPDALLAVVIVGTVPGSDGRRRGARQALVAERVANVLLGQWNEPGRENSRDVADVLPGTSRIDCPLLLLEDGAAQVPEASVEVVRGLNLDFLLHLGSGRVSGPILSSCPHGVWSFRHGRAEDVPGRPPCFWEFYDGADVIEARLERLGSHVPGVVLRQGWFKALKHSYAQSLHRVREGSSLWPAQVCAELLNGGPEAPYPQVARPPRANGRAPTGFELLRLGFGMCRNAVGLASRSLLRHEVWNLGVLGEPLESLLVPRASRNVRWFPEIPNGGFLADPFPVLLDGKIHVLCEEFDYRSYRGRIVSVEMTEEGTPLPPTPALDLGMHLSYPCVVVHNGTVFCVPEAVDSREISLYRAEEFPGRWEKVGVLVEGFPGVDNTIFRHEGRWWLAATSFREGKQDTLWLWHAQDLRGPWRAHRANPVKTDVRSARPGGTPFATGGRLYRPAQDCSRSYGGRIVINRVETLTPTDFRERPVSSVDPDGGGAYPDGLHTVSSSGGITVVDGRRMTFVGDAARHTLRTGARYARAGSREFVERSALPGSSLSQKVTVVD